MLALLALGSGLGAHVGASAGTLQSPGCMAGGDPAAVDAVDDGLDLHLRDGRVVRLAGLHAAPADRQGAAVAARASLEAWLAGADVRVAPLRAEPDRWGRTVALVFAPPPSDRDRPVSVAEAALDAGLAAAEPDPGLAACWPAFLELEAAARQARSGLWAGGDAVLSPADRPALARRLGSWTLVGGRVSQVRVGRARTYLRFGDDGGTGFAIALDRTAARQLARTAGSLDHWVGRRLIARGLLDDRWGLQIDVGSPEQVQLLPP